MWSAAASEAELPLWIAAASRCGPRPRQLDAAAIDSGSSAPLRCAAALHTRYRCADDPLALLHLVSNMLKIRDPRDVIEFRDRGGGGGGW